MIIVGFTRQLRSWWDNYMSTEAKAAVINVKAANEGIDNLGFALVKNREDVVYTLVLTILDIPKNDPFYAQLQAYLSQKQSNIFASIAKDDVDDIKLYEKLEKTEIIFLLENSEIQRKEEPLKIFQQYLHKGLYFPSESYKTRSYYDNLPISTGVEF